MINSTKRFKLCAVLLLVLFLFTLAACANQASPNETQAPTQEQTSSTVETKADDPRQSEAPAEPQNTAAPASDGSKTLVVYFSATGTTKAVAQTIASVTGAELYEITAAQPYTTDDLNWHDKSSRTTLEQNDKSARPAIASEKLSLDGYSTIYIGYPIWWGEEPRIMDTFVESYRFDGITMIPFCTSGGSGIGASGSNLAANAGSGKWLEGSRLNSASEEDVKSFISNSGQ